VNCGNKIDKENFCSVVVIKLINH